VTLKSAFPGLRIEALPIRCQILEHLSAFVCVLVRFFPMQEIACTAIADEPWQGRVKMAAHTGFEPVYRP